MTVTVLATPRIKTKRREPLQPIVMATSQAQARPASSAAPGRKRTRSSTQLSLTSVEKSEGNTSSAKRKQVDFDEEDGFQFTRTKSKKSKPTVETIPEVSLPAPENPAPKPSPRRGRPPKKRPVEKPAERQEIAPEIAPEPKKSARSSTRQTRGAAKTTLPEPEPQPASATRSTRTRDHIETVPLEKKRKKGRPSKSHEEQRNGFVSPEPQQAGTSKITLPMADTPVIQRNKELRGAAKSGKGNRRSSLGMRGRRASSLIDSGASNALPHDQVDTADFYKHIASDGLPEPRRMRQLLIWCATRAVSAKPSGSRSEDASARLAARVIQEELVKDFSSNSELSNWFAREDVNPPAVVVKKPNPKNVQNADKIKELEEQIQRLQRERHALNALLRPPSIPRIKPSKQQDSAPNGQPEPSHPDSKPKPRSGPEPINISLLDPSQQTIYESIDPDSAKRKPDAESQAAASSEVSLPPITASAVSTRLSRIARGLAPTLDSFAAGIHDIELYRTMSDTVSSRVLRICAERLEERDARSAMGRLKVEEDESESKDLTLRPRPKEDLGLILGALSRVERR
ncbi:Mis12-Mtw1 protein family-domain-containing protein [Aspergillus leporis]|uniref:Mis12-Mtw1 protein family-domain-containing protein n=1 Tax=Aspergillus leporis TaxID=41062 RepID=A0A5N5WGJ8_9EURO|nr:Mis12-Mtw1 protein family-domain-containing protein [Aspergillus leporis]